jgi:hypothetical protein
MSFETQTAPEVKPATRGELIAILTPPEVEAALLRFFSAAREVNPGITVIGLSVTQYSCDVGPHMRWHGHGVNSACDVGSATFAELVESLDRQIGPSADAAKRLRQKAAALLAEAEQVETTFSTTATA